MLFSAIFLFLMFLNIQVDLIILKTYDQQFTLTTKKSLHIIFKGKKLYFGFVDLEKAFDRVPREVIRWAVHKLGVEEWLVSAVMSMYTGDKTVVRTVMVIVAVLR